MDFCQVLRERRTGRRLSQLELASRAGTTQRHVSFVESGRSVPGRDLVVRLAEALELPLRERNELLLAAGFAPVYAESSLDDPALAPVRVAIGHILRGHLPYPALVVDRGGDLVAANSAFGVITEGAAAELLGPGAKCVPAGVASVRARAAHSQPRRVGATHPGPARPVARAAGRVGRVCA